MHHSLGAASSVRPTYTSHKTRARRGLSHAPCTASVVTTEYFVVVDIFQSLTIVMLDIQAVACNCWNPRTWRITRKISGKYRAIHAFKDTSSDSSRKTDFRFDLVMPRKLLTDAPISLVRNSKQPDECISAHIHHLISECSAANSQSPSRLATDTFSPTYSNSSGLKYTTLCNLWHL